jgi:hypothetical protein
MGFALNCLVYYSKDNNFSDKLCFNGKSAFSAWLRPRGPAFLLLHETPGVSFFVFHFYFLSFPKKPPMRQKFVLVSSYHLANDLQNCNFTSTAVIPVAYISMRPIGIT